MTAHFVKFLDTTPAVARYCAFRLTIAANQIFTNYMTNLDTVKLKWSVMWTTSTGVPKLKSKLKFTLFAVCVLTLWGAVACELADSIENGSTPTANTLTNPTEVPRSPASTATITTGLTVTPTQTQEPTAVASSTVKPAASPTAETENGERFRDEEFGWSILLPPGSDINESTTPEGVTPRFRETTLSQNAAFRAGDPHVSIRVRAFEDGSPWQAPAGCLADAHFHATLQQGELTEIVPLDFGSLEGRTGVIPVTADRTDTHVACMTGNGKGFFLIIFGGPGPDTSAVSKYLNSFRVIDFE